MGKHYVYSRLRPPAGYGLEVNRDAYPTLPAMERAAEDRLCELAASVELPFRGSDPADGPGGAVAVGADRFVVTCRRASDAASIVGAIRRALDGGSRSRGTRPLLCVLHMGPAGRKLCAEAGLGWFDLSGNADLRGTGLRIRIDGQRNRFPRPGRRSGFFAPKASRIARWLLIEHPTSLTFRDLVERSRLGKGYVSRVVAQMVASGLVSEVVANTYRVLDPEYLLEAWRDSYELEAHARLVGVVPPAEGPTNLRRIATVLAASGVRTVATGLAGAWLLRRHAEFRLTTLYVNRFPSADALAQLSFREEPRGANVWIVVPNDPGVFDGASEFDGIPCAHPVQVLLDLAGHPERASDAESDLRSSLRSGWGRA